MSVSYNEDGSITLNANYSSAAETIPPNTPQATVDSAIAAFFANDLPPATTKAMVLAQFSQLTGFGVADLENFFAGTMS